MIYLQQVTLICVDTRNYGSAITALQKSLEHIQPSRTLFITDIGGIVIPGVEIVNIKSLRSKRDYSEFMMKELYKHFDTSHCLIVQWDGYVLDEEQWDPEFLYFDYIGPSWIFDWDRQVGNGGFSMRSHRLHKILGEDSFIDVLHPEDQSICILYKYYLEQKYRIKFAPVELADKFGFELKRPKALTFGFHNSHHKPFKEIIVIKREAAMGDVIQVEPILEYFHKKGHPVALDTLPEFYMLFARHYFPVENYNDENFDRSIGHRVINLDMSYESRPQQLHLKSYFELAGITDYVLRTPKLNYVVHPDLKMFKKYVVLHIDKRETTHRNIFGVHWREVQAYLESHGFTVIQIGKGEHEIGGLEFNTVNEPMMMWLLAGCSFFVGIDSGPSHIAIALGRSAVLFFGSVNPEFIHHDLSKITVLQSNCPVNKQHCWHSEPGTRGEDCVVSVVEPPCCVHTTENVIRRIREHIDEYIDIT